MLKPLTFFLGLVPLGYALFQIYLLQTGGVHHLGADPGKVLVHFHGEWALRFLLAALCITPLRKIAGWQGGMRIRRMLGLFAFFYATLHLASYLVFLLALDFSNLADDIWRRPYITAGFSAYLILLPLALTSTDWMVRQLRHRWLALHRAAYLVAVLAIVHIVWLARASYLDAVIYGAIVVLLLFYRAFSTSKIRFRSEAKTVR